MPTPTYAVDDILEEVQTIVEAAVGDWVLPAQPTQDNQEPDDRVPTILVGVHEAAPTEDGEAVTWPAIYINVDSGRGGRMVSGEDRRVVVSVIIGLYVNEPSDYVWLARIADAVELGLLGYERIGGVSRTLDGKDTVVRWETVDAVSYPLVAGQLLAEVRLDNT
jgi:hypothetical protein